MFHNRYIGKDFNDVVYRDQVDGEQVVETELREDVGPKEDYNIASVKMVKDAVGKGTDEIKDLIPDDASEDNKLATASGVAGVQEDVDAIEGMIPSDTSTTNKLVNESGLQDAIDNASESWSTGFTPKGESSVSDLNGLATQSNGDSYIVTDSGTLTDGSLAVVAGDQVAWDATNSVWYKLPQYALKQFGTNAIKNLPTTIASFRTGDVIAVDGPSGGGKMSKDTLLELTAQNALADNVAPEFDESGETDYFENDTVVRGGKVYVFNTDHSGAWLDSDVEEVNLSAALLLQKSTNPEYVYEVVDSANKLLFAIDNEGKLYSFTKIRFKGGVDWDKNVLDGLEEALKANGFSGGQGDWSDETELHIQEPKFAVLNVTGVSAMPTTKTDDVQAVLQFNDMSGNYFKKPVVLNAQGNSTLVYPKKNIAVKLMNGNGSKFKLKIGDWVVQDSFHLKAYYGDVSRCLGSLGFDIYENIVASQGCDRNTAWKLANRVSESTSGKGYEYGASGDFGLRIDDGARCYPKGFPCVVKLNGEFYGIYCFNLKKDRDNYHQKKNNTKQVHLDGFLLSAEFWAGNINWTRFEVRNPSGLKDVDGNDYDGDDPKELSNTDAKSKAVKDEIVAFSLANSALSECAAQYGVNSDEFAELFETYFDVDNIIDMAIFTETIGDYDGVTNNMQWVTYDGIKWFACPYDLDSIFGMSGNSNYFYNPGTRHFFFDSGLPWRYVVSRDSYVSRLNARYKYLRDSGVVSADAYVKKVCDWTSRIGVDNYEKEFIKWPESPCNNDMVVNSNWQIVLDDGKPVFGESSTYDESVVYQQGDMCFYGANSTTGYYKFECLTSVQGTAPIDKYMARDSIWRMKSWLAQNINNMDELYSYNNT